MSSAEQRRHHAIGAFFIVRNSDVGREILKEWYMVPETYASHKLYKKENPQGLNFCFDTKIRDGPFSKVIEYAPPQLFTAPGSLMAMHDWFKDAYAITLFRHVGHLLYSVF